MVDVDITEFIQKNSELFVVLGVFSALAIYISDISSASTQSSTVGIRVGFVGALLLALLTILLIYRRLLTRIGTSRDVIEAHTEANNIDLILFTTSMSAIIPSLTLPILSREMAIYYVLEILLIVVFIPICANIVYRIIDRSPDAGKWFGIEIGIISGAVFFISGYIRDYMNRHPSLSDPSLFSLNNLIPAFGSAFYWVLNFALVFAMLGVGLGIIQTLEALQEAYGSEESDETESD